MSTELNRGAVPAINNRDQPSYDKRAQNEGQTKGQQGRPVFTEAGSYSEQEALVCLNQIDNPAYADLITELLHALVEQSGQNLRVQITIDVTDQVSKDIFARAVSIIQSVDHGPVPPADYSSDTEIKSRLKSSRNRSPNYYGVE